jgi:hypothetical protein
MMPLPSHITIGTLEVVEVFDYFEEPILFSCANERDQRFVGLLSSSNSNSQLWIYVPVSTRRLDALRDGRLTTYDVFRGAEGGALVEAELNLRTKAWSVNWVDAGAALDARLPLPGIFLDLM